MFHDDLTFLCVGCLHLFPDSNTKTCSAGQALTNKQLLQVAKTLGKEWEEAGINLNLKTQDLDDIKADGQMDVAMMKLKMLELWTRRRPPGKATAQDLLEGLKDMDLSVETKELLTGNLLHPHTVNGI